MGHELFDDELKNKKLITPFVSDSLTGNFYDFRVGRVAKLRVDNGKGFNDIDLKSTNITVKGHDVALLMSEEILEIPNDVYALVFLKSRLSGRHIIKTAGAIHPGYSGRLFINLTNLSDAPIEIRYLDKIVSACFYQLDREVRHPYPSGPDKGSYLSFPIDRLPSPAVNIMYDWETMSESIKRINKLTAQFEGTRSIVEFALLGLIAGIVAGLLSIGVSKIGSFSPLLGIVAILVAVVLVVLIYKTLKKVH